MPLGSCGPQDKNILLNPETDWAPQKPGWDTLANLATPVGAEANLAGTMQTPPHSPKNRSLNKCCHGGPLLRR